MATTSTPNAYLRTKIMTASPAELRLLLLDGAIKFAGQGRAGLERADYEAAYNGLSRCQAIVMELINGLVPEADRALYDRMSGLYTFLYRRLIDASHAKDPQIVDEVVRLLTYERETWAMVMEKLAEENAAAGALTETPDARPLLPPDEDSIRRDPLVGGTVSVRG